MKKIDPSQDEALLELEATRQSTSGFFSHGETSTPPREPYINAGNHMAARRHTPSMQDLPTRVVVQIVGHLPMTSFSPMDNLRSLRVTCRFLCSITSDRTVGQLLDVRRFTAAMLWNDRTAYAALLAHLTDIGNPEAFYITRMNNVFSKGTPRAWPCIVELARAAKCGTMWRPMWPPSSSSGPIPAPMTTKLRGGTCAKSRPRKKWWRAAPADQCSATRAVCTAASLHHVQIPHRHLHRKHASRPNRQTFSKSFRTIL